MNSCSRFNNQFHVQRFAVDRSITRQEVLMWVLTMLIATGACIYPNTLVRLLSAAVICFSGARVAVGLRRRDKDRVWPIWMDDDAISTLDDQRVYTQIRWEAIQQASVTESDVGNPNYKLQLVSHSDDMTMITIPSPDDTTFYNALKEYLGDRLSKSIAASTDLPTTSIGMIQKSRELMARFDSEFLRTCKGITPSQANNALYVDLPSIVTDVDEQYFILNHPDLPVVESLIRSAIRIEQTRDNFSALYNVAALSENIYSLGGELYQTFVEMSNF